MSLSAQEAANAVGLTKQAIIKAIRAGRLSGMKNADGSWTIEVSELFRVYQPTNSKLPLTPAPVSTPNYTPQNSLELDFLRESLKREQAERERERQETRERESTLMAQMEKLLDTLQQQTRLLEHKQSADTPLESPRKRVEAPIGFFGAILRRRA